MDYLGSASSSCALAMHVAQSHCRQTRLNHLRNVVDTAMPQHTLRHFAQNKGRTSVPNSGTFVVAINAGSPVAPRKNFMMQCEQTVTGFEQNAVTQEENHTLVEFRREEKGSTSFDQKHRTSIPFLPSLSKNRICEFRPEKLQILLNKSGCSFHSRCDISTRLKASLSMFSTPARNWKPTGRLYRAL
jgi:hypothetical protein